MSSRNHYLPVALLFAVAAPASADLITFAVTGEVTIFADGTGVGWTVPVGAPFEGSFTFDSDTPDDFPDWASLGQYSDSVWSSDIVVGEDSAIDTGLASRISVANDLEASDDYLIQDRSISFRGFDARITLVFVDDDQSVFADDSLPLTPPPLDEFERVDWSIGTDNSDFVIVGSLSSFTLAPEPTTLLMLAGGAVMLRTRPRRGHR